MSFADRILQAGLPAKCLVLALLCKVSEDSHVGLTQLYLPANVPASIKNGLWTGRNGLVLMQDLHILQRAVHRL